MVLASMISAGIFMQGCSSEDSNLSTNELSLNLKSPKGYVISQSVSSLRQEISPMIVELYGESKIFEITQIEYFDLEEGCIATIHYKTNDGFISAILKTNILTGTYDSNLHVQEIKSKRILLRSGEENSAKLNSMLITCRRLGECPCIPTFTTSGAIVHYSCGDCNNCEMTITF
jgi:hypothetical protein